MDETTKLALQIIALFVGVIVFVLWATKPLITRPSERVKEGATDMQTTIVPCPKCGYLTHLTMKEGYHADFIKCGQCGLRWKFRNLNNDDLATVLEFYKGPKDAEFLKEMLASGHAQDGPSLLPQPQLPPPPELKAIPVCPDCQSEDIYYLNQISCQCGFEGHYSQAPQICAHCKAFPVLIEVKDYEVKTILMHQTKGDTILAAQGAYDDSINNMVHVNCVWIEDAEINMRTGSPLDEYEKEVYNALKKAAEAGLDYVYFYQT